MPLTRHLLGLLAAACSVEASPVAFGTIDVLALSRGTGEVVVRCDEPTAFSVGISPGTGGAEGRSMAGPDREALAYALFADAGYSIPWGDGQAIGPPRDGQSGGNGGPTRLTIHGLVPRQPGTPPGSYADTLQVTLGF